MFTYIAFLMFTGVSAEFQCNRLDLWTIEQELKSFISNAWSYVGTDGAYQQAINQCGREISHIIGNACNDNVNCNISDEEENVIRDHLIRIQKYMGDGPVCDISKVDLNCSNKYGKFRDLESSLMKIKDLFKWKSEWKDIIHPVSKWPWDAKNGFAKALSVLKGNPIFDMIGGLSGLG